MVKVWGKEVKLEIERGGAFTPSRSGEFGEQTGVENGSFFCGIWWQTELEANQIGGALEATLNEH